MKEIPGISDGVERSKFFGKPFYQLSSDINEYVADDITEWLGYWAKNHEDEPLQLHISSAGGSLHHSLRIAESMLIAPNPIITIASGVCMSGATLVAAAGDNGNRWTYPLTDFMIHGIQLSGDEDISLEEKNREMKHINVLKERFERLLAKLTKQPVEKVARDLKRDKYLTARQAVSYGIVDNIVQYSKPR